MTEPDYHIIRNHHIYQLIRKTRRKLVWPLSLIILGAYMAFILALAFYPKALGTPLEGGTTSVGMLFGFALILLTFILTGIYSYVANRTIEPLLKQLHDEFHVEHH